MQMWQKWALGRLFVGMTNENWCPVIISFVLYQYPSIGTPNKNATRVSSELTWYMFGVEQLECLHSDTEDRIWWNGLLLSFK